MHCLFFFMGKYLFLKMEISSFSWLWFPGNLQHQLTDREIGVIFDHNALHCSCGTMFPMILCSRCTCCKKIIEEMMEECILLKYLYYLYDK